MSNFWSKLNKPFFILAPMADVTDPAFRQVITETGKPDVLYTEFVSADGLCSAKGRPKLIKNLKFSEQERPIVAQFFGNYAKHFYEAAQLAVELGFDGIDINMGCPASKIMKNESGAGLILNPELAKEIIRETKRGAGDLPVSVKTRIGYNSIITEQWISELVKERPSAIIVHGRTAKEMSKVPAHWDEIAKAAAIIKAAGIIAIGNGDVMTLEEGRQKSEQYGLDGVMIGRGIFYNPWLFKNRPSDQITIKEKLELLLRHTKLFVEFWGKERNFDLMKRFFKVYVSGFDGAKELREKLMRVRTVKEVEDIVLTFMNVEGYKRLENFTTSSKVVQ